MSEKKIVISGVAREDLLKALRPIQDPELGFSIVDLGLVYDVNHNLDNGLVRVLMTMTTPGCPLGDYFIQSITEALGRLPDVAKVEVAITFTPLWSPDKASDDIKAEFLLRGIPLTR